MARKFKPRENALVPDPNGLSAIVVTRGTAGLDDLAEMMIQQGCTLAPQDIRVVFESLRRAALALLDQGFRVTGPLCVLESGLQAGIPDESDSHDSRRHAVCLTASPDAQLEERWRAMALQAG